MWIQFLFQLYLKCTRTAPSILQRRRLNFLSFWLAIRILEMCRLTRRFLGKEKKLFFGLPIR